jgi:hypothetical protein
MRKVSWGGSLLISFGFLIAAPCYALSVVWTATLPTSEIQSFTPEELGKMKKTTTFELDPATGKKARFDGVLLSDVIDRALNGTSNDRKSQIDLVILKDAKGARALIPRSFIVKYPMLLALSEDHKPLGNVHSIVPWTSQSKSRTEGLPLETYFLTDVTSVELANYHQRYGNVFLKRRTEPLAMRGEKIFVQACLACHDSAEGTAKARNWVGSHPQMTGIPKLDERDVRALHSYLDVYHAEIQN